MAEIDASIPLRAAQGFQAPNPLQNMG